MSQSNSAAPLYTLATTGKFIDTHVGGCEDGAVLMTMCCLCAGISAQHAVPSNSSHKVCSIDNSESVFGKAGVTFDAQPPFGQYTMMTTESQYQAYVNSLTKIY